MAVLHIIFAVTLLAAGSNGLDYVVGYFDQILDHFNFESYGNQIFQQRYLFNDTWWNKGSGPILFYAGNKGDITKLWDDNGFLLEIAPNLNALVVFVEHRYYGESLPFGQDSFQPKTIGLLSTEQALADYASFLERYKTLINAQNCPVMAFGGGYGGILATYMSFKYPHIINGSLASSAPIFQVAGKVSAGDIFFQAVTKDYQKEVGCENQVRAAFTQIQKWAALGPDGFKEISKAFHLCKPLLNNKDYDHFLRWVRRAFVIASMMNYPYPTDTMGKLPPFPVRQMCFRLKNFQRPVDGLYSAIALYYNSTVPPASCSNIYEDYIYCADPIGCDSGVIGKAWDYQTCTEINLEGGTNGISDMFPVLPFNSKMRDEYCLKMWNVSPRRNHLSVVYGGMDVGLYTRVIFSNGDMDPYAPGGVLPEDKDYDLYKYLIEGGAHQIDLRASKPNYDSYEVRMTRDSELDNIKNILHIDN